MSTARISRISRSPLSYVALLGLAACCDAVVSKSGLCIVGAGPGGVQLGQYLSMSRSSDLHDYVIFERAARAGEFFRRYPVHRELISINKRLPAPWPTGRISASRQGASSMGFGTVPARSSDSGNANGVCRGRNGSLAPLLPRYPRPPAHRRNSGSRHYLTLT